MAPIEQQNQSGTQQNGQQTTEQAVIHNIKAAKTLPPQLKPIVIITNILAALLLLALIVSGFLSYSLYHNTSSQNKELTSKTTQLMTTQTQMQQNQQQLQTAIVKMQQNINMGYYLNMLATTDQLVTAANLALKGENNQAKALALLNTAYNRLANINDFFAITQALENDINNIKNTATLNAEKIALRLNKLSEQIEALDQALAPSIKNKAKEEQSPDQKAQSGQNFTSQSQWRKTWRNISAALRNVITISRRENMPLALTSSQLTNLKLNLQALLLEASWAANHQQNEIYQTNLKSAINLLHTYFPANEDVAQNIIPAIEELAQIGVTAPDLNLNKTLTLIENTLAQKSAIDISGNTNTQS